MSKIKLNYAGFLNSSGFSFAAQNYITALYKTGKYDIQIELFGGKPPRDSISDENYEFFMKMVHKKEDVNRITVYHCIPTMQRRAKNIGPKRIGMATFETFSPPQKWIDILNTNDAIMVPSRFNYTVFAHSPIKKPIYYVPHSIDTMLYNEDVEKLRVYDKFTFLFMGTWKTRKGYKQLVEAWLSEFTEEDNVQLLIKTDRPKEAERYIVNKRKQMGINKGFAPIIFENKVFDEKKMPKFIKSSDCLIMPTMGEGVGIPGLQCMALKIPVIITNFSGCQEYANEETALLLEPSGFILYKEMDNIPQFKNKKWAFIEVSNIRKAMRFAVCNYDIMKKKAEKAYIHVMKNFNYDVVELLFSKMIREVYG